MLEGLEISEIRLSALERTGRLDSQFYSRENLSATRRLDALGAKPLTDFATVSDGNHMGVSDKFVDDADGIPYYRGSDIYNLFIEQSSTPMRIDRDTFQTPQMTRSHLRKGDVLMSIVGAIIGNLSLVTQDVDAACSCKLAILRPKSIRAELLSVFLSSYFGQVQVQKFKRGAAQTGLILEDFDQLKVPDFSKEFETKVVLLVNSAFEASESIATILTKTEAQLLAVLGLGNFSPPSDPCNIKSFNDSFAKTGRLDAEYFYPAKEDAQRTLANLSSCNVGDLFVSIKNLWQPENENEVAGVRNYDLTDALSPFLDDSKEPVACTDIASTKKIIIGGDLVVSRLRSYLKEIAVVKPGDGSLMVASTEYIVLRPRIGTSLPVEALLVYLRSELPQLIFKWSQDGSNHPRFDEGVLLRLPVPTALIASGNDFRVAVQKVITLRERANQLLEVAKRAVEIAIEQDEAAGMAYLAREYAINS